MTQPWLTELDALYQRILCRPMDPSGYATYSALLIAGDTSLEDIAQILKESEEHQRAVAARERAIRFRQEDRFQAHAPPGLDVRTVLLRGDPARVAHVERVIVPGLVRQGIAEPTLVDAFDGNSVDDVPALAEALGVDGEMLVSTTSAFMRRKLASSASHARAWGALRDGMPTLILEDDAVFAGDALQRAATVIAEADRLHPRWHLIQLYSNCRIDAPLGAGVVPFGRSVDAHHGTVGYIISPQGAVTLSALLKQCWRNLSSTDLRKLQHEPHFALDLILMQWARTGAISVLWSTDRMVETIGQVGPLHREGDLLSTIFSRP